jgi:hypothetical protein
LINSCEVDAQFPPEKQKVVDDLLGDGKYAPGYVREYFPGCTHGFAVLGDMVGLLFIILCGLEVDLFG